MSSDLIRVNDLLLTVLLYSGSRWPPKSELPTAQPILITLAIPHDIRNAAQTDDLSHSVNYSTLASTLRLSLSPPSNTAAEPAFRSLESIVFRAFDLLLNSTAPSVPKLQGVHLKVVQKRPPLHVKNAGIECRVVVAKDASWLVLDVRHFVEDLECHTIIGVNAVERVEKQLVRINISTEWQPTDFSLERDTIDFRELTRTVYNNVEGTSYLTLEALASRIALDVLKALLSEMGKKGVKVIVKAAKPDALVFAGSSEVEVCRTFDDYPNEIGGNMYNLSEIYEMDVTGDRHKVVIAIGSNLGDSFQNIELALRLLEAPSHVLTGEEAPQEKAFVDVVDTSFLYESAPMYVTAQPPFINGACIIETNFQPLALLRLIKGIEERVGRVPSIRNGPRAIDLDILFFDVAIIDTRSQGERKSLDNLSGHLVVPHPRMVEREFVLRPLNDMMPDFVHPVFRRSVNTLLRELTSSSTHAPMKRVIPIPRVLQSKTTGSLGLNAPPTLTHWNYPVPEAPSSASGPLKTHLMTILNVTPDSFSDGSRNNTVSTALSYAQDACDSGSDIIDIGGYSTRPGADFVSVDEEINRVVPVVEAIRRLPKPASDIPISIDTFRPEVARAGIRAGANCINDVYAFSGPDYHPSNLLGDETSRVYMREMKKVAAEFAVPVVLMHSRGDAGKNKDYNEYKYATDKPVLEAVRVELGAKVDAVVKGKGGVRRWLVVVDPGVGFSRSVEDNLQTLRHASKVTADVRIGVGEDRRRNPLVGYPQLIGPSRKSFLGQILSTKTGRSHEPNERVWATAATVSCAVQQGALVVRVHDSREARDVIAVSDALWR
ncbi:Dihydropteroate synthase [Marasmius fiardii PR-910]|nr:Dihydropteroate synthase [Marasmius fiardii PR-910]